MAVKDEYYQCEVVAAATGKRCRNNGPKYPCGYRCYTHRPDASIARAERAVAVARRVIRMRDIRHVSAEIHTLCHDVGVATLEGVKLETDNLARVSIFAFTAERKHYAQLKARLAELERTTPMDDIQWEEHDDVYRALTRDGFILRIGSPDATNFRPIDVSVPGFVYPVHHSAQQSMYRCKERAAEMLSEFRNLAEHFREQGRAEVHAAQGELAKAALNRDVELTRAGVSRMPPCVIDAAEKLLTERPWRQPRRDALDEALERFAAQFDSLEWARCADRPVDASQ